MLNLDQHTIPQCRNNYSGSVTSRRKHVNEFIELLTDRILGESSRSNAGNPFTSNKLCTDTLHCTRWRYRGHLSTNHLFSRAYSKYDSSLMRHLKDHCCYNLEMNRLQLSSQLAQKTAAQKYNLIRIENIKRVIATC